MPAEPDLRGSSAIGRQAAIDSNGGISGSVSGDDQGKGRGDVTDFEAWEIEYLSAKVFSYVKRKLEIESERHGRSGFNSWM